jgi:hypothetical protein
VAVSEVFSPSSMVNVVEKMVEPDSFTSNAGIPDDETIVSEARTSFNWNL